IDIEDQNVGDSCGEATNLWFGIGVDELAVIPREGRLDIRADLQVWMNNFLDPFAFKCSVLSCDLFINAFPASVSMPATVAVIYDAELGRNVVDVVMGELSFTHGLTEGHIQTASSNCLITSVA